MLYAQVIVKKKTKAEELTYTVPAEIIPYLKIGSLVAVPVRQRISSAVVVGLKSRVSSDLKAKLKPILRLDRKQPAFTASQIAVAEKLAEFYAASRSVVALFAFNWPNNLPISSTRVVRSLFAQGRWSWRKSVYQQLIVRFPREQGVLIFPTYRHSEDFFRSLPEVLRAECELVKPGRKITKQTNKRLMVGNLSLIFWPLSPGDLLIIDSPNHFGNRYGARPFMGARTISLIRQAVERLRLVWGSEITPIEDLDRLRHWLKLAEPSRARPMRIFSRRGANSLFPPGLEELIDQAILSKRRILFLALARGWARALICQECQQVISCRRCAQIIAVESGDKLVCRYCRFKQIQPKNCPNCKRPRLRILGEGVSQVKAALKQRYPKQTIAELSSDQPNFSSAEIIVATEKIFSFPTERFDLAVIASLDRLLSGNELDGQSQLISFVRQVQDLAGEVIVQTDLPEHPVWGVIAGDKLDQFYRGQLELRRTWRLPPYGTLVYLRGSGRRQEAIKSEFAKLSTSLKRLVSQAELGELTVEVSGAQTFQGRASLYLPHLLTGQLKRNLSAALPPSWQMEWRI